MKEILSSLKSIWPFLSTRRRRQFVLLLSLMLVTSLLEVFSIGAILPFLAALTNPDQVYNHPLLQPFIEILTITSPKQLLLPLTILFAIMIIFSGALRLFLLYAITRFSFATGADLSVDIYRRTLYQDYETHLSRNSSELINGMVTKTNIVTNGVLLPILMFISSIIILVGILGVLFTINTIVAFTAFVGFGLLYRLVISYNRRRIARNSKIISKQSTIQIKTIQEGLGGIRDVLLDGSQKFYCQLFRNADLPIRRAYGDNIFIAGSPRYIMEAIGMVLITSLAYIMTSYNQGINAAIPILGAFALGAQRMLPAMQQAYSAYSVVKSSDASFIDVLGLLRQSIPKNSSESSIRKIPFKKSITLKNISFRYTEDAAWAIQNINLYITKGSRIGIIGESGSGKSTLIDIFMGLLSPLQGEIIVDEQILGKKNIRKWQSLIAHVPQNIYLSDGTIAENIAFGVSTSSIDLNRVKKASKQAQLDSTIGQFSKGYQTLVGEQGVRLSGGQRQRIGIARALYKRSDILVFDEATSSLDNETEEKVMDIIEELSRDLTVIIIAHRITTLKKCDRIIRINNHKGCQEISYNSLI